MAIAAAIMGLSGCLSYYRPDPLAGLDPCRRGKATISVSVNRYRADHYFDGLGSTPHTSRARRAESKYLREDITVRLAAGIGSRLPLYLSVPVTHVYQRGSEPGTWGVKHVWIATATTAGIHRRFSLLLGLGIPLSGSLGRLQQATADQNAFPRITIQSILSNGSPEGRFGYLFRLGGAMHAEDDPTVQGIYEMLGEWRILIPVVRPLRLGIAGDSRFVLIHGRNESNPTSHDATAIGPAAILSVGNGWRLHISYRTEVIGYYASAGSSWNMGLSYDWPVSFPGRQH